MMFTSKEKFLRQKKPSRSRTPGRQEGGSAHDENQGHLVLPGTGLRKSARRADCHLAQINQQAGGNPGPFHLSSSEIIIAWPPEEVQGGNSMNELQVFQYHDRELRTLQRDGEPWFVLKDVCKVLNMDTSKIKQVADRLDPDEKGRYQIPTPGGPQDTTIINESGLYAVILRSDKPEAKPFRKWVTSRSCPPSANTAGTSPGRRGCPRTS